MLNRFSIIVAQSGFSVKATLLTGCRGRFHSRRGHGKTLSAIRNLDRTRAKGYNGPVSRLDAGVVQW